MGKNGDGGYRILSFDGGGLRGLLSLELMKRISAMTKSGNDWYTRGDFYAGTSTGGLIALGLASGKSLPVIEGFYTGAGPKIFDRKSFYYFTSFFRFAHIGYKRELLRRNLEEMFSGAKLTDLEKDVLVVSFDVDKDVGGGRFAWQPKVIHNFAGRADDISVVEAGLRTSAAPTYLPSRGSFIDGGVCANNPSMCALAQILDERNDDERDIEDAVMISIGTGNNPTPIRERDLKWGILKWNTKLLKLLNDGGIKMVDYQCTRILKDRYLRIDVDLPEKIDLDDVRRMDDMRRVVANVPDETILRWARWIDDRW